jgi:hypothetical protein
MAVLRDRMVGAMFEAIRREKQIKRWRAARL